MTCSPHTRASETATVMWTLLVGDTDGPVDLAVLSMDLDVLGIRHTRTITHGVCGSVHPWNCTPSVLLSGLCAIWSAAYACGNPHWPSVYFFFSVVGEPQRAKCKALRGESSNLCLFPLRPRMGDSNVSPTQAMVSGASSPTSPSPSTSRKGSTAGQIPLQTFEGVKFAVPYKILVPAKDEDRASLSDLIEAVFSECDAVFNVFSDSSEISNINELPKGVDYPLSGPMEEVLHWVGVIHRLSDGRFDPTIRPLMQLWKMSLEQGREPDPEALAALEPVVGWDKVTVSGGYITKHHDDAKLDLCGIAKGWCVDALVRLLNEHNCQHVYVDWGGDVRASGWHPEHREWAAAIVRPPAVADPVDPEDTLQAVELAECAMATSGDYMQPLPLGHAHIFDPLQRRPLKVTPQAVASASVQCGSCLLADAVATVLCVLGTGGGTQLRDCEEWIETCKSRGLDITNYYIYCREGDAAAAHAAHARQVGGGLLLHGTPPPARALTKDSFSTKLRAGLRVAPHAVAVVTALPPVGDGRPEDVLHGAHAVTYSSVAPLFDGAGRRGDGIYFNVLRPSRMHTLLTADGPASPRVALAGAPRTAMAAQTESNGPSASAATACTVCVHFLAARDWEYAGKFVQSSLALKSMATTYSAEYHSLSIDALAQAAYHCRVVQVRECGDHVLVVAKVLGPAVVGPPGGPRAAYVEETLNGIGNASGAVARSATPKSQRPVRVSATPVNASPEPVDVEGGLPWTPVVYCMGSYHAPKPKKFSLEGQSDVVSSIGDLRPPVVITMEGKPGLVGTFFTACSLVPPMASVVVEVANGGDPCPVTGKFRVNLPQGSGHPKVEQLLEQADNPWASMYATPGHAAMDSKASNAHLDCTVDFVMPVPADCPRRYIVVGSIQAASVQAAKLPLVWLCKRQCSLEPAKSVV